MRSILKFLRENPGYLPFFLVGFISALPYSVEEIESALMVTSALMMIALVASLLTGFAEYSLPERWNKFWLLYAPFGVFGAYACDVVFSLTAVKLVLAVFAMGMHISFWNASTHSRAFRLSQYKLGFAAEMPVTTKLIACLNGTGRSELGGALVQGVLSQKGVPEEFWTTIPDYLSHLVGPAKAEYTQVLGITKERTTAES